MPTRPAKRAIAALAGLIPAVAVAGIAADALDERSDIRMHAAATTGGNPDRGEELFIDYGCGGCHKVAGVRRARGMVGPPLDGIANRAIIGGRLSNTPENMEKWIRDPQAVSPGTAMPDLDIGQSHARDIAAFLYTRAE